MQTFSTSTLLIPFETLINRCIKQDIKLATALTEFDGKLLEIEVSNPRLNLFVFFNESAVRLSFNNSTEESDSQDIETTVDGKISGSASILLELLLSRGVQKGLVQPGLQIGGDSDFVLEVHRVFSEMEIDWQEPLAKVVGDVPTHALDQLVQTLTDFARNSAQTIKTNIDEYLHEESKVVPPLNQVEIFDRDLDALKLRVDRLSARQRILANRLKLLTD